MPPHWLIERMGVSSGKWWRHSCTFQPKLSRKTPVTSSHPKDIQEVQSILHWQDNVLLPQGFTEFFYHVGNGKELRSIVNHGLIPGRVSLRTGRQAVFLPYCDSDG